MKNGFSQTERDSMVYKNIPQGKQLDIERILFVRIHDYPRNQTCAPSVLEGDFWELLYAEKGLADIRFASSSHTLSKTELLFRSPSETIRIHTQSPAPAKLVSVGFTFPASVPVSVTDFFRGSILPAGIREHRLLALMVEEAVSCHDAPPFGAGQAAMLYLELLLIGLIRNPETDTPTFPRTKRQTDEDGLFRDIIAYMEENITAHLTIDQICRDNLVGRTLLKKLFTDNTGCGIIDYFSLMKINAAKQLIRQGGMNFSQIAERLGYHSIHYFSRQFKKTTGMTPTEYAQSMLPVNIGQDV